MRKTKKKTKLCVWYVFFLRKNDRRCERGGIVGEKETGWSLRESFGYVRSYQLSLTIFNLLKKKKKSLNNVTCRNGALVYDNYLVLDNYIKTSFTHDFFPFAMHSVNKLIIWPNTSQA